MVRGFVRDLGACAERVSGVHRDHTSAAQSRCRSGGGLRSLQNLQSYPASEGVGCCDDVSVVDARAMSWTLRGCIFRDFE